MAIRGLGTGKWLHNAGSVMMMAAYAILLALPAWALWHGRIQHFDAVPWQMPAWSWFSLAVFGQMTTGALSGFEYVAILAGECRSAARTVGQSVAISAPAIALMFILGTSAVLAFAGAGPIDLIGPIPPDVPTGAGNGRSGGGVCAAGDSAALGAGGGEFQFAVYGINAAADDGGVGSSDSGMVHAPGSRSRTPVNSIFFVAALVMAAILWGWREWVSRKQINCYRTPPSFITRWCM